MADRNSFGSKQNHSKERSNITFDQLTNNESNKKHCSRKRNLSESNRNALQEQTRYEFEKRRNKQSASEEEDDDLDLASNFFEANDEDDDANSSTNEESTENPLRNNTNFTHVLSIIMYYDNLLSQRLVYSGPSSVGSHYVVSYGTVSDANIGACDSFYGRINNNTTNAILPNGCLNRNTDQQDFNTVGSIVRHPFNNSRPTICNFGSCRAICGHFANSLPSLHRMPLLASETFCAVPGRTSLLSSTTKYYVTIGEIYRRISPPECLNASLLGGILRKAKSKDGGKTLRDSLKRVGLTLPAGRRKAATVTAWTALVEEEAVQMAKDFATVSEKAFPVRQIAEFICSRMAWHDDLRECRTFLEHARSLIRELSDLMNAERFGPIPSGQANSSTSSVVQHGVAHFSLLTHGFGPMAFVTVFDTLIALFDEMLKCCDRTEQHLNVPLSVISVTHIPSNRFTYSNNM
ncbi:unnamed protein product [Thelazia callipaeda]|uniref:TF_AP-2 domain-containing protein n=1 Tax=Thelazia callipaeda TaxID=103827 RepID=A0A0N5D6U6_THECL|nr:unnamed protein product [Thelazia callipaeda]